MLRRLLTFFFLLLSPAFAISADVPLEIVGGKSFSQDELKAPLAEQLSDIAQRGLTTTRADDTAYYLASFYHGRGFSKTEVTYAIRGSTLVLNVNEGPRTVIHSLSFRGNQNIPEATLFPYVSGVPAEKIAEAKQPYSEKELSEAADRVRAYYASEGYLDVKVETAGTHVSADAVSADVVLTINEGTRYTFGAISFTPGTGFTDAQLRDGLGAKPEGAFTSYAVDAMQRSLQSWLRGKGYFAVEVKSVWDKAQAKNGKVAVHFEIQRGAQYHIGKVNIHGTDRLRPQFMQQRFAGLKGNVYDPQQVDEKYRELQRTGMFQRLRVTPKESAPGTLDLDVEVEEAKQKEISLELGYGSYDGMTAGLRLSDKNLFGWGRPLSLRLESAERGFRGELLYVDPWFFETDWALRARLYSESRDENGYSKTGTGARADFTTKVSNRWSVGAFVEGAVSSITSTGIEEQFLGQTDYFLTAVGLTSSLDARDDALNPRRGWILANSIEFNALDQEPAFTRVTGRYSYYHPVGKSLIAVGLRAGWIIPIGDASNVPIDLRYFNGGGTTVRSFSERDLGPRDKNGIPIGGTWYTVGNIEWDFPMTSSLDFAVFADAGNLLNDESPSLNDLRYAIGAGIRYRLPIGPLRVDYGYNPDRRQYESSGALHISFGFAF